MKSHEHIKFNGALLDNFLAQGCYRMRQDIFTTDFIWDKNALHPVFWLRFSLQHFYFDNKAQKLLNANKRFHVSTRHFIICKEIEKLYQSYFEKVNFDAPKRIEEFLFNDFITEKHPNNLFDTSIIEVRENNKLIAAGIFDEGLNSLAGIMNFYDPAYKKYSLGKYLMLLKIQHAMRLNMQYYYPGYIAFNYPKFDYKLFPNPSFAEIFDSKKKIWLSYNNNLLAQLADELSE